MFRQRLRQPLFNLCTRDKRKERQKPRQMLRQLLLNLCCRDKREGMEKPRSRHCRCVPANFFHSSEKPFVCLMRFRGCGNAFAFEKGLLLYATERANAVKAPVSLKVRATDTAFHLSLKSQYRLPINLFWGLARRPYLLSRHGVRRFGPRNRNSASLIESPRNSIVRRSIPSPKPPCGGQP